MFKDDEAEKALKLSLEIRNRLFGYDSVVFYYYQ
jgi:hypothetical protein